MISSKVLIGFIVLVAFNLPGELNAKDKRAEPNAISAITGFDSTFDEFGVYQLPSDSEATRKNDFLIRYAHFDPPEPALALTMVSIPQAGVRKFTLICSEGQDPVFFQKMENLEPAAGDGYISKTLDQELAQTLYATWIEAISSARFGKGAVMSTGKSCYISVWGLDVGGISAAAMSFNDEKPTGKIRKIAVAVRDYVLAKEPEKEREIAERIRTMCAKFPKARRD